jgi:hypothetical protein
MKKKIRKKEKKERGFNDEKILKICSILPGAHETQRHEKELKLVHYSLLLHF